MDKESLKEDVLKDLQKSISENTDTEIEFGGREELKDDVLSELKGEAEVTRRNLIKDIGLGAAGLTLASPVSAAWKQLSASSQGQAT